MVALFKVEEQINTLERKEEEEEGMKRKKSFSELEHFFFHVA